LYAKALSFTCVGSAMSIYEHVEISLDYVRDSCALSGRGNASYLKRSLQLQFS
jgi:hypothetical protein